MEKGTGSGGGDTLIIHAGQIQFGQDLLIDDPTNGEDPRNESSLYSELDGVGNNTPRTVMLQLRGPPKLQPSQFKGGGAFAAHADLFLTTTDTFGASVSNGDVQFTRPVEDGKMLDPDLWFLSDAAAERSSNGPSQMNRMAYQANVVLDHPPLSTTSRPQDPIMHNKDFVRDLSTSREDQIASPKTLNIAIEDGVQSFPLPVTNERANRLIIFTGTAICGIPADGDGEPTRGVVRVRLNFTMPDSVQFVGSATVAAVASIHGEDDEDSSFGVDSAQTIVGSTDGNSIGPPSDGSVLPEKELYLIIDAGVIGAHAVLNKIAYQANVLVRDTNPDLESISVGKDGFFGPLYTATNLGIVWDYQLRFTGPIVQDFESVIVSSSNPSRFPMASGPGLAQSTLVEVSQHRQDSLPIPAAPITEGTDDSATITAFFTRRDGGVTARKATVQLISPR